MYQACKRVFGALPLAALVAGTTLVLHGGLFRKGPAPRGGKNARKRKRAAPAPWTAAVPRERLGGLADLRAASKGGLDPSGEGRFVCGMGCPGCRPSQRLVGLADLRAASKEGRAGPQR